MNGRLCTLTTTGSDEVSVVLPEDEKKSVTVIATINALGKQLPLWVILKGKTSQCERMIREKLRQMIKDRELPLIVWHIHN